MIPNSWRVAKNNDLGVRTVGPSLDQRLVLQFICKVDNLFRAENAD